MKLINYILDILMFIVPLLDMTEVIAVIPPHWLPWYMLGSVILRRLVRLLEERMKQNAIPDHSKIETILVSDVHSGSDDSGGVLGADETECQEVGKDRDSGK